MIRCQLISTFPSVPKWKKVERENSIRCCIALMWRQFSAGTFFSIDPTIESEIECMVFEVSVVRGAFARYSKFGVKWNCAPGQFFEFVASVGVVAKWYLGTLNSLEDWYMATREIHFRLSPIDFEVPAFWRLQSSKMLCSTNVDPCADFTKLTGVNPCTGWCWDKFLTSFCAAVRRFREIYEKFENLNHEVSRRADQKTEPAHGSKPTHGSRPAHSSNLEYTNWFMRATFKGN